MLTPFGIAIRKLRLDKGMRLLDVARLSKRSPAFISAVETGRKPIPDSYVVMMARAMDLSATEIKELRRAADRTRKEVVVERLPEDQRELVAAFARRIDELPSNMMADLKKIVLKSSDCEILSSVNDVEFWFHRCPPTLSAHSLTQFGPRSLRTNKLIFRSWTFWNFGWLWCLMVFMSTSKTKNQWAVKRGG